MSSPAFNPDDAGRRPSAEPESASRPDSNLNQQLFEQVLEETLALAAAGAPLKPDELGALIDVARRHGTAGLSLDAVADLVHAVLRVRFERSSGAGEFVASMSREIAATMQDDPPTWQRIETFWARLCEARDDHGRQVFPGID
jgi:hypothetical protein